MTLLTDETIAEVIPIGERCFAGCKRRAVIVLGLARYCARCVMSRMFSELNQ